MKKQKQVKINGLKFNKAFGTIQICDLVFDPEKKMYITKGIAGSGKTTVMTGLELGTKGSKALVDKNKYGKDPIDIEVLLTDEETKYIVSCKRGKAGLNISLYSKDENGKRKNISSPATYLDSFQTELTWKMNELVSERPSTQKNILLKIYQKGLQDIGVIFDEKNPEYIGSILDKIDKAEENRSLMDMLRKQKGGISEDLKDIGIDTTRPETWPKEIPISEIDTKIKAFEKEITQKETNSESVRDKELAEIQTEAQKLITESVTYNSNLKAGYDVEKKAYNDYQKKLSDINKNLTNLKNALESLELGYTYEDLKVKVKNPKEVKDPGLCNYIPFSLDGQKVITTTSQKNTDEENQNIIQKIDSLSDKGKNIIDKINICKLAYSKKLNEPKEFDSTTLKDEIKVLEDNKILALKNNEKVKAVKTFLNWQESDGLVKKLNNEYIKKLANVDCGVKGLNIVPENDDIFIMYDGSYDPVYFGNPKQELRKLSAYSTSQRPIICMMIQNYLLSSMDKVMRYIFIDNIPVDISTKKMIEKMSIELDLHIFLNMTGDFSKDSLKGGEILIEGGEVFFPEVN